MGKSNFEQKEQYIPSNANIEDSRSVESEGNSPSYNSSEKAEESAAASLDRSAVSPTVVMNSNNNNGTDINFSSMSKKTEESRNLEGGDGMHQLESNGSRRRKNRYDSEKSQDNLNLNATTTSYSAAFALKQVQQGKAIGNVYALAFRAKLHRSLFRLGCFIQKYAVVVFLVGLTALSLCCIGLQKAHLETDIEKLWVESGGRLEEELQYTKEHLIFVLPTNFKNGSEEFGFNITDSSSTSSYEIFLQNGENVLTIESMELHLQAAYAATQVIVEKFGANWTFSDICYKPTQSVNLSDIDPIITPIADELKNLFPCLIISPLDCFWEGSKLLGPHNVAGPTWKSFNPLQLFNFIKSFYSGLEIFESILEQAGIASGYTTRWCLNPNDPECPNTAPNFETKEIPNIPEIISSGCTGYATNVMQWPIDLLVGGIHRNEEGNITKAEGLQTLFNLNSPAALYYYLNGSDKVGANWSMNQAEQILQSWQRKFVETIYNLAENDTMQENSSDRLNAFTEATTADVLDQFSNIAIGRIVAGYALMVVYAWFTLQRLNCSQSQGTVGILGVLLVVLSVGAGLGICSLVGISFNAASTQVLPFLLLGLGVDDMFLMAHHFGLISVAQKVPYEHRVGECLKKVGVSVFLTSISIFSGFLFSLIIPMPALRAFGLQVKAESLFRLICIHHLALTRYGRSHCQYTNKDQIYKTCLAAIVTLFNLITVLVVFPSILSLDLFRRKHNKMDLLCCFTSCTKNKVIRLESFNGSSTDNSDEQRIENDVDKVREDGDMHGTTSLELHGQVNRAYERIRASECTDNSLSIKDVNINKKTNANKHSCYSVLSSISITKFGKKYYGPLLLKTPVRVIVLTVFACFFGASIYGCTIVKNGLDLGDVLPRGTRAHDALVMQTEYFSFYNMYINTKKFDYPTSQKALEELHDVMGKLSYVVRNTDGSLPKFWLVYFREWLQALQTEFDQSWSDGKINSTNWSSDVSTTALLAYRLLVQTGDPLNPIDTSLVGCLPPQTTCQRPERTRLVSDEGIINEALFYNYLSAWVGNDPITFASAQAEMRPAPIAWQIKPKNNDSFVPPSPPLILTQMFFYLNNMRENEDFVTVINWVRAEIDNITSTSSVVAYPSGYPFTYWQQYITIRFWLFISLACVIVVIFLVLAVVLVNPWAAAIMAIFLAMIAAELLGFMGFTGVKLSAVPAVILVATIGVGVEFTVHIIFAFISSTGTRNERVIYSIEHMLGPVVDGAISTLLGVIMLAWAEFDIIVKYFFHVLVALIFIGIINGLILLPVVLSIFGPPAEIRVLDEICSSNTFHNIKVVPKKLSVYDESNLKNSNNNSSKKLVPKENDPSTLQL